MRFSASRVSGCVFFVVWSPMKGKESKMIRSVSSLKSLLVVGVMLVLVLALALPVLAGGAASKATGSGEWSNVIGVYQTVSFNAHEAKDGRPAKGSLYQEELSGAWTFTVDVDNVMVFEEASYACFGGYITSGAGTFANMVGKYRWTLVKDGGEGTGAMDYLRGYQSSPSSPPDWCTGGDTALNEAFYGGNVQIHAGQGYE
jgi:hypothetical protein